MNRRTLLAYLVAGLLFAGLAVLDFLVLPNAFLGILYVVPLLVVAIFLPMPAVALFGAAAFALGVLSALLSPATLEVRAVRLAGLIVVVILTVFLAVERGRSQRSARQSDEARRQTAAILESITDAFFALDADWRFTYVNGEAERLLQQRREELMGKVIWAAIAEAADSTLRQQFRRAVSEGVTVAFDQFYPPLRRWFEIRAYPSPSGLSVYFRDVTERREAEEARSRLAAIVESSEDAIIGNTLDGVVTSWNPTAQRLYGYWAEEVIGKSLSIIMPLDGRDELSRILESVRRGERIEHQEAQRVRKDGTRVDVLLSVSPIRNSVGEIVGGATTTHDITESKRAQKEREHLLEEREDLIRMVSHDLRSPLTAVQGQAQILQRLLDRSGQGGDLRKSADAIFVSARRMNSMIQDLVDLARLESRQLQLNRTPIDLRSYMLELKQRMVGVLDTDRIRVEIPEGLPEVSADPDRLERVLTNLLSNGLKYSEAEVLITAERADGQMKVCVIDRGKGIPPEDQGHLFDRFYRAMGTRKAEGLGLGLYITRMLVEAQGGRIWVESEPGKGSTFSFTIALAS